MKRWVRVFKILSNINRLKIISLLSGGEIKNVGEIAGLLRISFKNTSRNLTILENADVLESRGQGGHVYYRLAEDLPADIRNALHLFVKVK